MKSDVKAVRVTGTGAVFAGRTRLRGMILASDGSGAGSITCKITQTVQLYFKEIVLKVMFLHLTYLKMEFYFQVE